ncbi:GNAT family N-acetyltransferase [Sinorhizobium sp. RAC02]|uniref:GNAT family N-acetyltransferase n=1 Tax=Sinorhizobium sp. RAC02 TaxID=1842534 RepID=UPI0008583091|nr:acetyltransferase family protein [Sinorhizobium sp. RAC02]
MTDVIPIDPDFGRWDDLLSLVLDAFAYMDGIIDPPSSAHRMTAASLAAKARGNRLRGSAGRNAARLHLRRPEAGSLYIGKLAVRPAFQGTGVGRLLLETAEALARERHLPVLRLETRIELVENHAAFARWGFVRTAENAHPGFTRPTSIEMRKTVA